MRINSRLVTSCVIWHVHITLIAKALIFSTPFWLDCRRYRYVLTRFVLRDRTETNTNDNLITADQQQRCVIWHVITRFIAKALICSIPFAFALESVAGRRRGGLNHGFVLKRRPETNTNDNLITADLQQRCVIWHVYTRLIATALIFSIPFPGIHNR